jgi:signal transduction histidine kinase
MAVNFRQRYQETGQLTSIRAALNHGRRLWRAVVHPQPVSTEYRQWRDRLIRQRFWLAVKLTLLYLGISGVAGFYEVFVNPTQLVLMLERHHLTGWLVIIQHDYILHKVVLLGLLSALIALWKSGWGQRHLTIVFVLFPWAITFIPEMVLGAVYGIPRSPALIMFMAQAVILPAFWRLHLLSQIVPILFYFLIYPLLGLSEFAGVSTYSFSETTEIILVCTICEVGVYLYEQSKQSELQAYWQLKLCLDTITHDLRTPVMGSLMLLESMRKSSPVDQPIEVSQRAMTQLIRGSDRILGLMDSLLIPQALTARDLVLHRQRSALSAIAKNTLETFHPAFIKQNIQINNRISEHLSLVDIDIQQVKRVFNNLITNAISYNPPGIILTLDAVPLPNLIRVSVQDNGIGISPADQANLFEPYTRGSKTQYLPGSGLGLYICRQVILAHGGHIEINSNAQGTVVWFTLPLSRSQSSEAAF